MSNSGQKMSTPGWCTFALLGGVLVVAFGAFASATPQNKSKATLVPAAKRVAPSTLALQAKAVAAKLKSVNSKQNSSATALSAVQTGSSSTLSSTLSTARPRKLEQPSRSNVASATPTPEGQRTAQGDTVGCATDDLTYDDGEWDGANGGAPTAGWTDAGTVNDFILPDPDGGGAGTSFTCAQVTLAVDPGADPSVWELRVYDLNNVDGAGGGNSTILGMGSFAAAVPVCTRTYTTAGGTLTVTDTGHIAFGRPVKVLDGVGDNCDLGVGHFGFHIMFPGIGANNFWMTAPPDGNADCLAVWGPVVDLPFDFCAGVGPEFAATDFKIGGVEIDCPNDVCGEGETTCNCPQDCGAEPCGNGICCASAGEDCAGCPEDCGVCPSCGDGIVDPGEDCDPPGSLCANNEICQSDCTCPAGPGDPACVAGAGDCCSANGTPGCDDEDCCNCICACDPFCCGDAGGFWDVFCAGDGFMGSDCGASNPNSGCATECSECLPTVCGEGVCDPDEDCCNCEADCGACVCGDGTCDAPCESFDNCPQDCDPPPEGCAPEDLTYNDGDWDAVNGGAPGAGWTDAGTVNDFILPDPDGGGTGTFFTCAQVSFAVDPGADPTVWELRVYDLNDVDGAGGGNGTILGMGSFAAAVPVCTRTYTTAGGTLTVTDTGFDVFGRDVKTFDGVGETCELYDGHFGFHVMFPGIGANNFWLTAPQDGNPDCLAVWGPVVDAPFDFCSGVGPEFAATDFKIWGAPPCNNDGVCDAGENSCNCEADCGACGGTCVSGACCGDGVVEGHEECDFGGCGTCPWDTFPVDGDVGAGDLAFLLGNWGPIPPEADPKVLCLDAEPDGDIGAFDLANVLGHWGPCPVGFGEDLCVEADCDAICECVGRGACCGVKGPGTCDELLTADECAIAGGNYVGDDTICADCPPPECENADGDCCEANGTPGCDDPDCCAAVCALAPICCSEEGWDINCAGLAADVCAAGCPIPFDNCDDPGTITDGDTGFDTTGGNTDGLPHAGCMFDGQTYHDIWFQYIATCTGIWTASTCDQAIYDTDLVMYEGCQPNDWSCPPGDAELLACNDDTLGCAGFTSIVSGVVTAGNCYTLRVGGWNDGDQGAGTLTLSCEVPCVLDCPPGAGSENPVQACPVDGDNGDNDPNGGCNSTPNSFDAIACGETICAQAGTYINIGGEEFRDTDWYEFILTSPATVTLRAASEAALLFGFVDTNQGACTAPAFIGTPGTTTADCTEASVTEFLAAGSYAAFGASSVFTGQPCNGVNNAYYLTLDVDPAFCGTPPVCSDGVCEGSEDSCNCPQDCGAGSCGDGICCALQAEDCSTCAADCGVCVGCDICYTNCDDITGPGAPCIDNGADDWMSNVTFAGINNSTGTEGCPCSYGNHSALQASVVAGQTYNLTVSFCSDGQWPQHVRAWFDWNGNLDYECGESVYLGTGIDMTLTAPVTVPAGTPAGCYSMRVLEEYLNDPGCSGACTGQTWGEAEDYTVCVQ